MMTPRQRAHLLASAAEERLKTEAREYGRLKTQSSLWRLGYAAIQYAMRASEHADAVIEESGKRSAVK